MSYVKPERRGPDMWDGLPYRVDVWQNGRIVKKVAWLKAHDDALLVWRQAIVRYPSDQVILRHRARVMRDSLVD